MHSKVRSKYKKKDSDSEYFVQYTDQAVKA